jgi:hypothetical protein
VGDRPQRARRRRTGPDTASAPRFLRARRAVATAVAAAIVVLGPVSPAAAQDDGQFEAPTDSGGQALWVVGEIAVLVAGSVGGRMWVVRRRSRHGGDRSQGGSDRIRL